MRGALLALGFDQFDDDIAPLVGAANDARKTAALFELSLGYQVEVLTHEELNQRRGFSISRSIKRLLEPLGPGDVFGIFIATHGKSLPIPGGKGRGQVFLLPDASLHVLSAAQNDPTVYNALGAGFLTMAQLDLYTYKPGVRRFSMLDACRSPIERADMLAAANRDGSAPPTALFDNEAGYRDFALHSAKGPRADSPMTIFNSCSDQELAAELPDQARGLFNLAVERVIRRRLAQGVAVVMDQAFNAEVQQEMALLADEAGLRAGRQTPILQGQSLALCAPESAAQMQARAALLAEFETRFAAGHYYRPWGQSANDSLQRLAGMGLPEVEFKAHEARLTQAQKAWEDERDRQREAARRARDEAARQAAAELEAQARAQAQQLEADKQAAQALAAQEAAKREAAEAAARQATEQAARAEQQRQAELAEQAREREQALERQRQAEAAQKAQQQEAAERAEQEAKAQAARTRAIFEQAERDRVAKAQAEAQAEAEKRRVADQAEREAKAIRERERQERAEAERLKTAQAEQEAQAARDRAAAEAAQRKPDTSSSGNAKLGWAMVGVAAAVVLGVTVLPRGKKEEPAPIVAAPAPEAQRLPTPNLNEPARTAIGVNEPSAAGPISAEAYMSLRRQQGAAAPAVLTAAQALVATDTSVQALAQPGVSQALDDLMLATAKGQMPGGKAAQAHWVMLKLLNPQCCQRQADLEAYQDQVTDLLWPALAAAADPAAPSGATLLAAAQRLSAMGESRWGSALWAGMLAKCGDPADRDAARSHFSSLLSQPVPGRVSAGHAQAYQAAAREALEKLSNGCR